MISFFPGFGLHQLLVERARTDVSLALVAQFELLLEKKIVHGCTLVFDVVLQISFGEGWSVA